MPGLLNKHKDFNIMVEPLLSIRIGHKRILDHLILGIVPSFNQNEFLSDIKILPVVSDSWDSLCNSLLEKKIHGAFMPIPMAVDMFHAGIDICLLMFVHKSGSIFLRSNSRNTLASLKNNSFLLSSEYSVDNMLVHRFLASAGLTFGDFHNSYSKNIAQSVDVVREIVPYSIMSEMMLMDQQDDIAGCMVCEPFASMSMDKGNSKMLCTSDELWPKHPCCGFVLYKEIVNQYPLAVEKILSIFCESAYMIDNINTYEDNHNIKLAAAKFLKLEASQIAEVFESSMINFNPAELIPEKLPLETIISYMSKEMKVLPDNADIDGFVFSNPIRKVVADFMNSN